MRLLSVLGTAAMFLVGGGILAHGIPWLDHPIKGLAQRLAAGDGWDAVLAALTPLAANLAVGLVAGAATVLLVTLASRARSALAR
jgi:predicted DNA repair protein MutK